MNKNCEKCILPECEDHGVVCPFYEEDEADMRGKKNETDNVTYNCAILPDGKYFENDASGGTKR